MENYRSVTGVPASTTSVPKHKAFMIVAGTSNASATLTFYGRDAGITGASATVNVNSRDVLILPIRVKSTGALSNCTCYTLN